MLKKYSQNWNFFLGADEVNVGSFFELLYLNFFYYLIFAESGAAVSSALLFQVWKYWQRTDLVGNYRSCIVLSDRHLFLVIFAVDNLPFLVFVITSLFGG